VSPIPRPASVTQEFARGFECNQFVAFGKLLPSKFVDKNLVRTPCKRLSQIRTGCDNQRPSGSVRWATRNGCLYRARQLRTLLASPLRSKPVVKLLLSSTEFFAANREFPVEFGWSINGGPHSCEVDRNPQADENRQDQTETQSTQKSIGHPRDQG
jgi:hypothetical protein